MRLFMNGRRLFKGPLNIKHFFLVSIGMTCALATDAFAGNMGPVMPGNEWSWVGTLSAGPVWAKGGDTQTFYLTPDIEKTYLARKSSNALASGELFIGKQKNITSQWLGQLGLAVATTGDANMQGIIWDDASPQFNNHSYQYKVNHTRVAVKGKLLLDKQWGLIPWVSASMGIGFNRAHDFSNTPLIFEALPNPDFSNHTKTAFTYTLGVGVQKSFNHHWQVGIGYEFADWGKNELGSALGQTLNSGLMLSHLYTNGALLNFSYRV